MAVWGTPAWANGGQAPQYAPADTKAFQDFMQALASRYSGRYPGYPFVRFYGIWNESNLATFLRPQFDPAGKIVGPSVYARLAIAGLRGVKAGNTQALVAIGETSSNGRNKHVAGLTDTVAPGTFLELVAKAAPRLHFDAWAQHPYPFPVSQAPTQKVRWPNIGADVAADARPRWTAAFGRGSRLDHRVRKRDQAGRAEGSHRGPAGRLPARRSDRPQGPARADVHLVRVSGLDREHVAERPLPVRRDAEAGRGRGRPLFASRHAQRVGDRPGGTVGPIVTAYVREFCNNNPIGAAVGTTDPRLLGRQARRGNPGAA